LPSRRGIDERFVTPVCERRHEMLANGGMGTFATGMALAEVRSPAE
jgi:hypothetical protein